jgi:RNA-directed DNA polymerase
VAWRERGQRLGVLIRYADDIVALCSTQHRAGQARELMVAVLAPLGLKLHPAKTGIVHLHGGAQGFEFLGFHHHKVESWRWPGRYGASATVGAKAVRGKRRAEAPGPTVDQRHRASRPPYSVASVVLCRRIRTHPLKESKC